MKTFALICALIVTAIFVFGAIVELHRRAIKRVYWYWWLSQTIGYPFMWLYYKRKLKYLSVKELDALTDNLVTFPDTWFIRKLLVLVVSQRIKLEDYV